MVDRHAASPVALLPKDASFAQELLTARLSHSEQLRKAELLQRPKSPLFLFRMSGVLLTISISGIADAQ